MTATEIEDLIVARLRDRLLENITVEAAPEDPSLYAIKGAKGCVLVRYASSTYTPPERYALIQQRTARVSVICGARSLRIKEGHQGVLDLMEAAIQALTMFKASASAGRFYVQDDEFIREEKSVWWYGFTVIVPNELHYQQQSPLE